MITEHLPVLLATEHEKHFKPSAGGELFFDLGWAVVILEKRKSYNCISAYFTKSFIFICTGIVLKQA